MTISTSICLPRMSWRHWLDDTAPETQEKHMATREQIMESQWTDILSAAELDAQYALTASLDPAFARRQREFYEGRTVPQLQALATQAWNCCDPDGYQLARSHAALQEAASASAAFQDISTVTEYGLTQRLSAAIRCF